MPRHESKPLCEVVEGDSACDKPSVPLSSLSSKIGPLCRRVEGKVIKIERHILAVDADLEHAIDQIVWRENRLECRSEQDLLQSPIDVGHDDDQACNGVVA